MGASQHSGVMVACYLPPRLASRLALPGGERPEDLHVTLAYVKPADGAAVAAMRDACRAVASAVSAPLRARLGGVGRFFASETSDGQDVHYASIDSPDLPDVRHALVSGLEARGVQVSRAHGFSPHVTLAYASPDEDRELEFLVKPTDLALSGLWMAQGNRRLGFFPFGAPLSRAAGEQVTRSSRVVKLLSDGAEEQFVLGVVLEPDVVDGHGDTYDAAAIREAAHGYMAHQQLDIQHSFVDSAKMMLVESFLAPCPMVVGGRDIKPGTWLIGVKVLDPQLWADIKAGRFTGFSIGGMADRERLTPSG